MALKVKAVERLLKFDKESAGKYRYVMKACWLRIKNLNVVLIFISVSFSKIRKWSKENNMSIFAGKNVTIVNQTNQTQDNETDILSAYPIALQHKHQGTKTAGGGRCGDTGTCSKR